MAITQLQYALQEGYFDYWLAAGPQVIPIPYSELNTGSDPRMQIIEKYHQKGSGIKMDPVERGPVSEGTFKVGDYEGSWAYVHCQEDHFIDHSAVYRHLAYTRSWAFTELVVEEAQEVTFILSTNGPADFWLNNKHIHRQEHFQTHPKSVPFNASLATGANKILIRFENAGSGGCPDMMALRVCKGDNGARDGICELVTETHVEIPTLINDVARRNELEESFMTIFASQDVYTREDKIEVCWPGDLKQSIFSDVRLEAERGMVYAHAEVNGKPGDTLFLSYGGQLQPGRYKAFLMPRGWEYYERDIRISKDLPFWVVGDNPFSTSLYGGLGERRKELWQHAILVGGSIYTEIARMASGAWESLEKATIRDTMDRINQREAGSVEALAGLFRMLQNFGNRPGFPRQMNKDFKACILGYRYWSDEPGVDALEFSGESDQILFHACEILAGQRYPDLVFTNNGENGRWHRKHGEKLALEWLKTRGTLGFSDWNSDASFAGDLVALSLLVDYAKDEDVGEMAAILMDKIFYAMALNSFQGVLGASARRASLDAIRGGYLQETSGVSKLMWGQGVYNQNLAAPVSLSCTKEYELPVMFQEIAGAAPDALWSREKHAVRSSDGIKTASISTFRSPVGLISSAQDFYPGCPGGYEHIWQATLGPGATVFTNHPANASRSDAAPANFWRGNKILPRIGQWKDTLVAIYRLPADDWMGFTHAYFPTFAFDAFTIQENWAFARKGDGYLALTASTGIELAGRGREALREIRSPGPNTIWICQMGGAQQDKDFDSFQEAILAGKLVFEDLSAQFKTIRGEKISFGWEGSFRLDGVDISLESDSHYDSLFGTADFPTTKMEIQYGDSLLRLDLTSPDEGGDVS